MPRPKTWHLLEQLLARIQEGAPPFRWERTIEAERSFRMVFGGGEMLRLDHIPEGTYDRDDGGVQATDYYRATMLDPQGNELDTVWALADAQRVTSERVQFEVLRDIYEEARAAALNVDSKLDALLQQVAPKKGK